MTTAFPPSFFIQPREVTWPGLEDKLVEAPWGEFLSPEDFCFLPKQFELQIPQIIFQIIYGLFRNILVDAFCGGRTCDSDAAQNFLNLLGGGPVIMDGKIQKRVQAQMDIAAKTAGFDVSRHEGVGGRLLLCIKIGKVFHVVSPAFHVASVMQKMAQEGRIALSQVKLAVYGLVEVAGITFVGQGGIECQVIRLVLPLI